MWFTFALWYSVKSYAMWFPLQICKNSMIAKIFFQNIVQSSMFRNRTSFKDVYQIMRIFLSRKSVPNKVYVLSHFHLAFSRHFSFVYSVAGFS